MINHRLDYLSGDGFLMKLMNCEEYVEEILNKSHVFITPGFIFGENGERYIRISLCATEEKLTEAKEEINETISSD